MTFLAGLVVASLVWLLVVIRRENARAEIEAGGKPLTWRERLIVDITDLFR